MLQRNVRVLFQVLLALGVSTTTTVSAQNMGIDLRSLGLEPAWAAVARTPTGGHGIASCDLWLDNDQKREYAVVELADRVVHVAADQLDDDLKPLGMERAKALASSQASRILGRSDGFEVTERTIGQLRLVVTTTDGLVQCFDAETGKLYWATPCGEASARAFPPALSKSGVVIFRDRTLYLLDWTTGKQLQERRLSSGTSNLATIIDAQISEIGSDPSRKDTELNTLVLVSDLKGLVSGYSLSTAIPPWSYQMIGRSVGAPISLPDRSSTAIATDIGWLYVFTGARTPNILFRYEAGSKFFGSMAAGDDAYYVGDAAGTVSKISTRQLGRLEWSYRLSQSISSKPLVDHANGQVYVSSEAGELTAIEDSTGLPAWNQTVFGNARIHSPVAICNGYLICRTLSYTMAAYDVRSGQLRGQSSTLPLGEPTITNSLTDRLYLAGRNGQISCFRPIGRTLPRISPVYERVSGQAGEDKQPPGGFTPEDRFDGFDSDSSDSDSDPFGDSMNDSDPFGAGSDPIGADDDPFGDGGF